MNLNTAITLQSRGPGIPRRVPGLRRPLVSSSFIITLQWLLRIGRQTTTDKCFLDDNVDDDEFAHWQSDRINKYSWTATSGRLPSVSPLFGEGRLWRFLIQFSRTHLLERHDDAGWADVTPQRQRQMLWSSINFMIIILEVVPRKSARSATWSGTITPLLQRTSESEQKRMEIKKYCDKLYAWP